LARICGPITSRRRVTPRAHWRATLPGVDVGLDTWPAAIGQGGFVEVWAYPHDAEDYVPLLWLPGAPPLLAPRELQPGEMQV
jgi:hypothetical protein